MSVETVCFTFLPNRLNKIEIRLTATRFDNRTMLAIAVINPQVREIDPVIRIDIFTIFSNYCISY